MTPKKEFLNALKRNKLIQSIPIWELEFHLWDKFGLGNFTVGSDFADLPNNKKEYAMEENAETADKVCELLHFSAITIPGEYWEVAPSVPAFYWMPNKYRIRQTEIFKRVFGDKVALVANVGGVMAMPEGSDYIDFSIKMMEQPKEIDVLAKNKFMR